MSMRSDESTHPSLFLRLNEADVEPRELAWGEFHARYSPIIAGFARRMGASPHESDDIVQQVMLGFFRVSPNYVYDSRKGRFRSYLWRCTYNEIRRQWAAGRFRRAMQPLPEQLLDPNLAEEVWNDQWEQQLLRRALEDIRRHYRDNTTFRAFQLYVMLGVPAEEVARRLKMQINSVHKAKERVTAALRERVHALQAESG